MEISPENRAIPEENFVLSSFSGIPELDDADLRVLGRCRRIRDVAVHNNDRVTVAGLGAILAGSSSALEGLAVQYCRRLDGRIAEALGRHSFPKLRRLAIHPANLAGGEAWNQAPALPALENLDLGGMALSEAALEAICRQCPGLKRLNVHHDARATACLLCPLASLKRLEHLDASSRQWSAEGVAVLRSLPEFRSLGVLSPVADPPGSLRQLAPLADKLTALDLYVWTKDDPGPSDDDYAVIFGFRKLESLLLRGIAGAPTDAQLAEFAKLPHLKDFTLDFAEPSRRYTAAGIASFRRARPDVEINAVGTIHPRTTEAPPAAP